ncbi:uncharacterized protein [Cicer arietinum]|uniref:uncharacterized protein n=1 Tax=Cicer arietinum TaxID=3827 RepID=UPI003CC6BB7F
MKSNLLSIGQLIQKGFSVIMKDDALKMYDGQKKMILKAHFSKNITFVINIQATNIQCLKVVSSIDENMLWHSRFGYPNFRSLQQLEAKKIVSGIPIIDVPGKMCEMCMAKKQSTNSFKSQVRARAKKYLEVIHSDIYGSFKVPSLGGYHPTEAYKLYDHVRDKVVGVKMWKSLSKRVGTGSNRLSVTYT